MMFPIERTSQRALVGCAVIFSLLPTAAVCLRIKAHRIAGRRLDASDLFIIAACTSVVVYQGNVTTGNRTQLTRREGVFATGAGYHISEITGRFGIESGAESFLKIILGQQIIWGASLALVKTSILLLYTRIFTVNYFIYVSRVTIVVIWLWALAVCLGSFLICRPIEYNWDQTVDGECGSNVTLWLCTGVLNIVTDLVVLLLPMPYLYGLQLELYKKLVLMGTFGVGLLVCIISIIRLISLLSVNMADATYTVPDAILYSALEPSVAIILACVPLLRPLIDKRGSRRDRGSSFTGNTSNTRIGSFNPTDTKCRENGRRRRKLVLGFETLDDSASTAELTPDQQPGLIKRPDHISFVADCSPGDEGFSKDEGRGRTGSFRLGDSSFRLAGHRGAHDSLEMRPIEVKKAWELKEERA